MTWLTSEVQYNGLPLLLRKPNYPNVWDFAEKFNRLVIVEHILGQVTDDGLPEKLYNYSLKEFDHFMCNLLDTSNEGIIILIETFGGKRNYYYYTSADLSIEHLVQEAENKFGVQLKLKSKLDYEWNFIKEYPFKL